MPGSQFDRARLFHALERNARVAQGRDAPAQARPGEDLGRDLGEEGEMHVRIPQARNQVAAHAVEHVRAFFERPVRVVSGNARDAIPGNEHVLVRRPAGNRIDDRNVTNQDIGVRDRCEAEEEADQQNGAKHGQGPTSEASPMLAVWWVLRES